MTADEFINAAIDRGQSEGLATLTPDERFVFLISEAEVYCDMEGIDALIDRYSATELSECASAFSDVGAAEIATSLQRIIGSMPDPDEEVMSKANDLIALRTGYDYDAIRAAVERRFATSL